jgi:hypothetical protein
MTDSSKPGDFRVDVGRASAGRTFVRVVHLPTGKERIVVGLDGAEPAEVALRLTTELDHELRAAQTALNPPSDLQPTSEAAPWRVEGRP